MLRQLLGPCQLTSCSSPHPARAMCSPQTTIWAAEDFVHALHHWANTATKASFAELARVHELFHAGCQACYGNWVHHAVVHALVWCAQTGLCHGWTSSAAPARDHDVGCCQWECCHDGALLVVA